MTFCQIKPYQEQGIHRVSMNAGLDNIAIRESQKIVQKVNFVPVKALNNQLNVHQDNIKQVLVKVIAQCVQLVPFVQILKQSNLTNASPDIHANLKVVYILLSFVQQVHIVLTQSLQINLTRQYRVI
jgi:hypothetical protein